MPQTKEIQISSYHLIEGMQHWLANDSAGSLKGRVLSFEGGDYIEREGVNLLVRVGGVEQIYSFKGLIIPVELSKYRGDFSVHTVISKPVGFFSELQEFMSDSEFKERFRKRIEESDKNEDDPFSLKRFYQIFGEPRLEAIEVGFKKNSYAGFRVSTTIKNIPTGAGGSLANSFFNYAEVGIAKPLREIVGNIGE